MAWGRKLSCDRDYGHPKLFLIAHLQTIHSINAVLSQNLSLFMLKTHTIPQLLWLLFGPGHDHMQISKCRNTSRLLRPVHMRIVPCSSLFFCPRSVLTAAIAKPSASFPTSPIVSWLTLASPASRSIASLASTPLHKLPVERSRR
jgi:hypothetical protein